MAKKAESNLRNMFLSLTIIALVVAVVLALVNNATKGPIAKVEKEKKENAVKNVLPFYKGTDFKVDDVQVSYGGKTYNLVRYLAIDADSVVGKAFESYSDNGFGGRITAMVGFDAQGNISGYEVLSHSETPGLGAKADKWFQPKELGGKGGNAVVVGLNPSVNNISVKKDGGDIDAITGSTITSRAFCGIIAVAYEAFKL